MKRQAIGIQSQTRTKTGLIAVLVALAVGGFGVSAFFAHGFSAPLAVQSTTTSAVLKNAIFQSFTKDAGGNVTAVSLMTVTPDTNTNQSYEIEYTFAVTSTSTFRDKNSKRLGAQYVLPGHAVTAIISQLANGTLLKLVDRSAWNVVLPGKVVNTGIDSFGFVISRRVREILQNATYQTSVSGGSTIPVYQLEITKTGSTTTRTMKTKTWADILPDQAVTVTGVWDANKKFISATAVRLPNLLITP